MSQSKNTFKAIPGTTLRRLRNTPSYFFLIWRWTTWVFALIWIVANPYTRPQTQLAIFLERVQEGLGSRLTEALEKKGAQ